MRRRVLAEYGDFPIADVEPTFYIPDGPREQGFGADTEVMVVAGEPFGLNEIHSIRGVQMKITRISDYDELRGRCSRAPRLIRPQFFSFYFAELV